jgi:hypothetical protein
MRKSILASSITLLAVVTLTTQAAPREKQQAEAPKPVFVSKNSPAAERAVRAMEKDRERRYSYRGLSVEPHPEAAGDELAMQERIAALMARLDYVPAHRAEHFRWVHDELNMPIYGWKGKIAESHHTPDGVVVTVRIWPIAPFGTGDNTLETYLYNKAGRLIHLHSEGAALRAGRVSTFGT